MRTGELDTYGLDSHTLPKLQSELDYYQIPTPTPSIVIDTDVKLDIASKSSKITITGSNFIKCNEGAGDVVGFNGSGNWATIFGTGKGDLLYWEVKVVGHAGPGHIRLGIANKSFDKESSYVGSTNSLAIYPGNTIQYLGSAHTPEFNDSWAPGATIGMFFNRTKGKMFFYSNKKFAGKVENIPNPQEWLPAFCVHCASDSISMVPNPVPPSDLPLD